MTTVFPFHRLTSSGLALLVALGALHVVVAGDSSPGHERCRTRPPARRRTSNAPNPCAPSSAFRRRTRSTRSSGCGPTWRRCSPTTPSCRTARTTNRDAQAIQNYFLTKFGEGTHGLKPGGLHTQMVLRPLINVSADGQSAKGRWWEFSMTGQHGVKAEWAAGIFENEYVRERGVWKISRMRYNPMFAGPYATGWRNVDEDQKIVPYHFTPDETGIPVPDLPASAIPPADPKIDPKMTRPRRSPHWSSASR